MRYFIAIASLLVSLSPVSAQTTLRYEATIGTDGKVTVAPSEAAGGSAAEMRTANVDQLYILKDAQGAVKAIYPSQSVAMEQLSPGDSVEAVAAAGTSGGTSIDSSAIREAAEKVARDLLEQTRSVMCEMEARPTSFTTGAEISFHLFAGTTLQVSATWESEKVCG